MKLQETYTENTYERSSYLVILKIFLIVSTRHSAKRKIAVSWRSLKEYLWKKHSRLFCIRREGRQKRQNKIRTTMRNVDVWQLNEAVFANRVRPILSSFFARRESAFIEISWLIRTKRANTRLDTIQWVVVVAVVVVVGAISHDLQSRTLKRWRRTKIFLQFTYTRYSSGVSPSAYVSDPWLRVKRRQLPFVPPPPPSPRSLSLLFSLSLFLRLDPAVSLRVIAMVCGLSPWLHRYSIIFIMTPAIPRLVSSATPSRSLSFSLALGQGD